MKNNQRTLNNTCLYQNNALTCFPLDDNTNPDILPIVNSCFLYTICSLPYSIINVHSKQIFGTTIGSIKSLLRPITAKCVTILNLIWPVLEPNRKK